MSEFCSQIAQQMNAPLYGTASSFRVALLIEYSETWNGKAVSNNSLPPDVQAWIDRQKSTNGDLRPLFIRRQRSTVPKTLYVAVTDSHAPRLYKIPFATYDELPALDVNAIIENKTDARPVDETLVAICTNGRHDQCCAKFGLPVYHAFDHEEGIKAWQCTHLGGHRYASTAVVLPTGVTYGFLSPQIVPDVADAIRNNQIHLPCYRGCAGYSGAVNAADYFLRQSIGETGLSALRAESWTRSDELWRVRFANGSTDRFTVELRAKETEPMVSSCGDKPPKPQVEYRLVETVGA